ncbi:uncharacterized protein LOC132268215 isoform X2 [Cornus florida]|uniref:uncharacterized protein LOC132268215 isoform X2 n=1 Tax=Cornus florida TaxID=4283 RepID=UPI00289BE7B8|nr:uncharacterized protein LOC132268215 isoform X2 [Cornus florida]
MKKDWQTHHLMLKRSIGNFWLGIGVRLWRRRSAKKNKECRGKQTMMHTIGTKSFARVSAEIEEDEGIQLSRADLFISTHVNKDGKATDAAASEMIENIRELQKSYSDSPIGSSNDLFSIVRGEERTGCVRMLGFGPTPNDVWVPLLVKLN